MAEFVTPAILGEVASGQLYRAGSRGFEVQLPPYKQVEEWMQSSNIHFRLHGAVEGAIGVANAVELSGWPLLQADGQITPAADRAFVRGNRRNNQTETTAWYQAGILLSAATLASRIMNSDPEPRDVQVGDSKRSYRVFSRTMPSVDADAPEEALTRLAVYMPSRYEGQTADVIAFESVKGKKAEVVLVTFPPSERPGAIRVQVSSTSMRGEYPRDGYVHLDSWNTTVRRAYEVTK